MKHLNILFGLVFVMLPLTLNSEHHQHHRREYRQKKTPALIINKVTVATSFDSVAHYIKQHEGLKLEPYICPGGHKTIGYGHLIRRGEKFSRITKEQAERILYKDLTEAYRFAINDEKLPVEYALTAAHFIYCLGSGNYMKSSWRKALIEGDLKRAKKSIVKWSRLNGRLHPFLYQMREYEVKLMIQASSTSLHHDSDTLWNNHGRESSLCKSSERKQRHRKG